MSKKQLFHEQFKNYIIELNPTTSKIDISYNYISNNDNPSLQCIELQGFILETNSKKIKMNTIVELTIYESDEARLTHHIYLNKIDSESPSKCMRIAIWITPAMFTNFLIFFTKK